MPPLVEIPIRPGRSVLLEFQFLHGLDIVIATVRHRVWDLTAMERGNKIPHGMFYAMLGRKPKLALDLLLRIRGTSDCRPCMS